jgi:methyl-accepting chemotaxis protein
MADDNPLSTAFELQRKTIEQSNEAFKRSLDFQRQLNEHLLGGAERANEQGAELTRKALHSYLDTIETAVPGADSGIEEVRSAIDEQFDAAEQAGAEAIERRPPRPTSTHSTSSCRSCWRPTRT